MESIPALTGIGIVAFVSTNIDDLVMLIGFFADAGYRPRQIVAGQFAGIAALIAAAFLGALAAHAVPSVHIGLLGLVPIAIGVKKLIVADVAEKEMGSLARGRAKIVTVAMVTVANGGDNISLYIPLFSVHSGSENAVIATVFLLMTALWCAIGYGLVGHRVLGLPARRWGAAALPYVLIALGLYILGKSGWLG
jgi:cadmium resistance protein CadD (predicted permease)